MKRVFALWNRFWFEQVDGLPLGVTRIGVAATGWVLWVGTLPLVRHFYSDAGEFPISAARSWAAEYVARFLMPDFMGPYPAAAALFALWGLALLGLLLGRHTRLAAWTNWLLTSWFLYRNPTFNNGGDEVFRLVSLYLALAYTVVPAAHRSLSLDRRQWVRAGGDASARAVVPVWTLRMVQIQIALVYLVAGFWKVAGPSWWDGTALHYALDNSTFTRFGAPDWPWLRLPYTVVTITVAWWEFLFPALVALRRTRIPTLLYGVAMHVGILVFMYIGIFPFVMIACYPAFLTGKELRALGRRLRLLPLGSSQPQASTSVSTAAAVSP